MADIADRRTEGFSQGQRVKTAIARALVHDPRNVILDEPTNGLDVMATRAMRELHAQAASDEGRCVLFSSHIMQEVGALCDRIVVIAHGRVVADESPEALREQTGAAQPRRRVRQDRSAPKKDSPHERSSLIVFLRKSARTCATGAP